MAHPVEQIIIIDSYTFLCAGNNESDKIRKIDFYNIMVSFWRRQEVSKPLKLICLGILIKSNLIFLTAHCAEKLKPANKILIKSGGYAIHNILQNEMEIVNREKLHPHSMFSIVYVSNSTYH